MISVYVDVAGAWKFACFECACHFSTLSEKFLADCSAFRPPNAQTANKTDMIKASGVAHGCSNDLHGYIGIVDAVVPYLSALGDTDVSHFQRRLHDQTADDVDQFTFTRLLDDPFFSNDFINIVNFLKTLPLKSEHQKTSFYENIVQKLRQIPVDVIGSRLTTLLLSRFVVIDASASKYLLPYLLKPDTDSGDDQQEPLSAVRGILPMPLFQQHIIPEIYKMFHVRDVTVRCQLLQHFNHYAHLFSHNTLTHVMLPQVLLGLHDVDDELAMLSLHALATLVAVLGGDAVIGHRRHTLFTHGQPKGGAARVLDHRLNTSRRPMSALLRPPSITVSSTSNHSVPSEAVAVSADAFEIDRIPLASTETCRQVAVEATTSSHDDHHAARAEVTPTLTDDDDVSTGRRDAVVRSSSSALQLKSPVDDHARPPSPTRTPRRQRPTQSSSLGAEFDVKQIQIQRRSTTDITNVMTAEVDYFADMAPVIAPSKGLLLQLQADISATADDNLPAMTLNISDGWENDFDWSTVDD